MNEGSLCPGHVYRTVTTNSTNCLYGAQGEIPESTFVEKVGCLNYVTIETKSKSSSDNFIYQAVSGAREKLKLTLLYYNLRCKSLYRYLRLQLATCAQNFKRTSVL